MCSGADMLYLASARSRTAEPNSVSIYGFSTEGTLTLKRSVTIEGIGHVTGIAEDPGTCSLWIAGFSMEAPEWPTPGEEPFYSPRLAVLPADSNDAQLMDIEDSDSHDLALPMSVIWTRRCGGADLSGDGGVDFDDFAELASRFLAESGQGRYDIDCDLTSPADGTIDFKDLLTFTNFWLHTGCAD